MDNDNDNDIINKINILKKICLSDIFNINSKKINLKIIKNMIIKKKTELNKKKSESETTNILESVSESNSTPEYDAYTISNFSIPTNLYNTNTEKITTPEKNIASPKNIINNSEKSISVNF